MKHPVLLMALKLIGEAILFALVATIIILILGRRNQWDSITYSNAFFIAGGFLIIAGGISRLASGEQWNAYMMPYSESHKKMSASERANAIIEASTSLRLVILGALSGAILILLAAIAAGLLF